MKITPDELVTLLGRIREEERHRASSILADRERELISKLGKLREDTQKMGLPNPSQIMAMLDYLDSRPAPGGVGTKDYSKLYPTMFKGGPP